MSAAGVLALWLSAAVATAPRTATHEPVAAEAKALAGFELHTDELVREGEDIAALSRMLDKRLHETLTQRAVSLDDAAAPKLRLQLRWLDYDRSDYAGAYELQAVGSDAWTTAAKFECFACSNTALAKRASEVLPEALRAAARPAEAPATTSTPSATTTGTPATTSSDGGGSTRRPLGGMGKGGIAMLAIGVVGIGVGAGLLARSERADGGNAEAQSRSDSTPAGIGVLAAGGALAVVGIALLATDRVRAKRRTVAVAPAATSSFFGLALAGRF
ncbi:MAG: hypothetical protein K1X88_29730 [Nannocystaceae bacterium]|nr:hypothetical protein [Nannocystaceae bacterium]